MQVLAAIRTFFGRLFSWFEIEEGWQGLDGYHKGKPPAHFVLCGVCDLYMEPCKRCPNKDGICAYL